MTNVLSRIGVRFLELDYALLIFTKAFSLVNILLSRVLNKYANAVGRFHKHVIIFFGVPIFIVHEFLFKSLFNINTRLLLRLHFHDGSLQRDDYSVQLNRLLLHGSIGSYFRNSLNAFSSGSDISPEEKIKRSIGERLTEEQKAEKAKKERDLFAALKDIRAILRGEIVEAEVPPENRRGARKTYLKAKWTTTDIKPGRMEGE